jgi:hypothetical protein
MAVLRVPDESVPLKGPVWRAVAIKLDLIGFVILAPSTVMLLLALAYGGIDYPWDSAVLIGLFCGAAVGIAIFLVWEQKLGVEGMFPTPLIRRQVVAASCFSQFLFFGALYVATYYISIYFQSVQGVSPLEAGVRMLPLVFLHVATVIVTGGLSMFSLALPPLSPCSTPRPVITDGFKQSRKQATICRTRYLAVYSSP